MLDCFAKLSKGTENASYTWSATELPAACVVDPVPSKALFLFLNRCVVHLRESCSTFPAYGALQTAPSFQNQCGFYPPAGYLSARLLEISFLTKVLQNSECRQGPGHVFKLVTVFVGILFPWF